MKKSVFKDLRNKSDEELKKMVADTKKELVKIMIQHKSGKLKDVMLSRRKKKDIARMLTILREKKITQERA
ncbi:50S ribosomal protein L29 [Patescibacteria group bacterium]|nr:50S ribosomal protein L29 [Patescibacteria group bacterium]MCL5797249.1 50S ribosomal protein L29 [Patescibacteria group bacterium]